MKRITHTLIFSLLTLAGLSQQEPQFKFYLAFEDAKQERDTVWFGIDESASNAGVDSIYGDTAILLDTGLFQAYYWTNDTVALKTIINGTNHESWGHLIFANKYEYPISVRWDSELLTSHTLPFELKQAHLYNDNYLFNEKVVHFFDQDSVILEPFSIGGGAGDHFPLTVGFSKNPNDEIGIGNHKLRETSVYPIPCDEQLSIQLDASGPIHYLIFDPQAREILEGTMALGESSIHTGSIPAGHYILQLQTLKAVTQEKILIIH